MPGAFFPAGHVSPMAATDIQNNAAGAQPGHVICIECRDSRYAVSRCRFTGIHVFHAGGEVGVVELAGVGEERRQHLDQFAFLPMSQRASAWTWPRSLPSRWHNCDFWVASSRHCLRMTKELSQEQVNDLTALRAAVDHYGRREVPAFGIMPPFRRNG